MSSSLTFFAIQFLLIRAVYQIGTLYYNYGGTGIDLRSSVNFRIFQIFAGKTKNPPNGGLSDEFGY
jgi:hypothetical protein